MDGDHSAKTMEQGANSAMKDDGMASGIHESTKQTVRPPNSKSNSNSNPYPNPHSNLKPLHPLPPLRHPQPSAGDKTTGGGTSMFSKDGALGSMFNGTTPLLFQITLVRVRRREGNLLIQIRMYSGRSYWGNGAEGWRTI